MTRVLVALACAGALVGCAGGSDGEASAWNHDPEDTALGPAAWGEIDESFEQCAAGAEQSPIDITGAERTQLPVLEFDYPETSLIVENTGHTIEARLPEDSDLTLRIGDDEYRLVQFHFHAPSEHMFQGDSYDVEVHLVHESEEGELAVIAVFLTETFPVIELVDLVVGSAPEESGEEVELDEERTPLELLLLDEPALLDGPTPTWSNYYTYPGSLTTPGCGEGVRWIVLPPSLVVSREAVARLHELIADFPEYDGYENNNRPTQPLNERVIQYDSG